MLRLRHDDSFELRLVEEAVVSLAPPRLSDERREALRTRIMSTLGPQDAAPQRRLGVVANERWVLVPAGVGVIAAILAAAIAAVDPQQAGVELFGGGDQIADVVAEQRGALRVGHREIGGEAAVAAQLEFGQFAREIGAVVEQPGDGVHHPGGGAQCLARQRNPRGVLVERRIVGPCGQIEGRAHFVREDECLAIEPLDDPGIDVSCLFHNDFLHCVTLMHPL